MLLTRIVFTSEHVYTLGGSPGLVCTVVTWLCTSWRGYNTVEMMSSQSTVSFVKVVLFFNTTDVEVEKNKVVERHLEKWSRNEYKAERLREFN